MESHHKESRDVLPRLSICIPFYKQFDYLVKAVESVLGQTCALWELWIVDDCGPDSEQVQKYVRELGDVRIHYHRNVSNLGLAGNWNRCIELSSAEFVTLLHSDDELQPDYAKTMLEVLDQNPHVIAACCRAEIIDSNGNKTFSVPDFVKSLLTPKPSVGVSHLQGESAVAALLRGNFIVCPTLCYRRASLGTPLFDGSYRMVLDLDVTMRFLLNDQVIVMVGQTQYRYRRHDSNQTVVLTSSLVRFQEEVAFYRSLKAHLQSRGWQSALRILSQARIIKFNLVYCILLDVLNFRVRPSLEKLKFMLKLWAQPI